MEGYSWKYISIGFGVVLVHYIIVSALINILSYGMSFGIIIFIFFILVAVATLFILNKISLLFSENESYRKGLWWGFIAFSLLSFYLVAETRRDALHYYYPRADHMKISRIENIKSILQSIVDKEGVRSALMRDTGFKGEY